MISSEHSVTINEQKLAPKQKLLIIEDDEAILTQMKWALAADYEVFGAEDEKGLWKF